MRSTDYEYAKRTENRIDHHQRMQGERSPFTRGRALATMVNVQQLPVGAYQNLVYSADGAVQIFYFVVGYSRVGGPDVVM